MSAFDPQPADPREAGDAELIDDRARQPGDPESPPEEEKPRGHGRWMMIACCVPMLAIAVAIAASGAGFGFLIVAVMCTAMMALMMGGMSDGDDGERS